jgi:hypothetical protein
MELRIAGHLAESPIRRNRGAADRLVKAEAKASVMNALHLLPLYEEHAAPRHWDQNPILPAIAERGARGYKKTWKMAMIRRAECACGQPFESPAASHR